jgi:hypothetical protein
MDLVSFLHHPALSFCHMHISWVRIQDAVFGFYCIRANNGVRWHAVWSVPQ